MYSHACTIHSMMTLSSIMHPAAGESHVAMRSFFAIVSSHLPSDAAGSPSEFVDDSFEYNSVSAWPLLLSLFPVSSLHMPPHSLPGSQVHPFDLQSSFSSYSSQSGATLTSVVVAAAAAASAAAASAAAAASTSRV